MVSQVAPPACAALVRHVRAAPNLRAGRSRALRRSTNGRGNSAPGATTPQRRLRSRCSALPVALPLVGPSCTQLLTLSTQSHHN